MDERLCTTGQAAKYLGVTSKTVVAWCKRGVIKEAVLIGWRWKIPSWRVVQIKKEGLVLPE